MASSSTPDSQSLLAIGKQCSHPTCLLVDFLPFKCHHCAHSFCQEHFKVDAHNCTQYDESKHNRVAPNCPLCNTPVAIRPGQDPNDRMEEHFAKECSVMTGRQKAKSTPLCAKANCKRVLFSPIRCDKCRSQFCPSHRFPSDHNCSSLKVTTAATAAPTNPAAAPSKTLASLTSGAKNLNIKANAAGASIEKSLTTTTAPATTSKPSTSSMTPNLFSKTDRLSPQPLTNDSMNANDMTITTNTNTTNDPPKSRPSPAIDPMAFVPPPIFAY